MGNGKTGVVCLSMVVSLLGCTIERMLGNGNLYESVRLNRLSLDQFLTLRG